MRELHFGPARQPLGQLIAAKLRGDAPSWRASARRANAPALGFRCPDDTQEYWGHSPAEASKQHHRFVIAGIPPRPRCDLKYPVGAASQKINPAALERLTRQCLFSRGRKAFRSVYLVPHLGCRRWFPG
jgi:hypothetical protein